MADSLTSLIIQSNPNLAYKFCNSITRGVFPWSDEVDITNEKREEQYDEIANDKVDRSTLQRLCISNSKIGNQNIESFSELRALSHVNLSYNRITEIASLGQLSSVKFLDISHNKIENMAALRNLVNLEVLRMCANCVNSLDCISGLLNLSELWMAHNNIPWSDALYLANLTNLTKIAKLGNPCDEKPKFHEFLLAICPRLQMVDGVEVTASMNARNEFLRTTDGRVMLTQAKAIHSSVGKSMAAQGITISSPKPTRKDSTVRRMEYQQEGAINSPPGELMVAGNNPLAVSNNSNQQVVMKYKMQKPGKKNGNIQRKTNENAIENGSNEDGEVTSQPGTSFGVVGTQLNQSASSSSSATMSRDNQTVPPSKVIRFGNNNDAPVALSLNDGGDGYIRWSKGGGIACSMERGRFFCSHRSGAIAAVVDSNGSGSVMDSRGRCLLMLNEQGTAQVLDNKGLIVNSYNKSSNNSQSESHFWTFDGLQLEFLPSTWEVLARVQNDRVTAQFSSLSGGILVKEKDLKQPKDNKSRPLIRQSRSATDTITANGSRISQSGAANNSEAHDPQQADEYLQQVQEQHQHLRQNVNSIITNLNDMMAQIAVRK